MTVGVSWRLISSPQALVCAQLLTQAGGDADALVAKNAALEQELAKERARTDVLEGELQAAKSKYLTDPFLS